MTPSILQNKRWAEFREHFGLNRYDRDKKNGDGRPRIEVRPGMDPEMRRDLLRILTQCPACDALVFPVRERKDGSMYYAAACKLEVNVSCSRSRAASNEYTAVANDIEAHKGKRPGAGPTLAF